MVRTTTRSLITAFGSGLALLVACHGQGPAEPAAGEPSAPGSGDAAKPHGAVAAAEAEAVPAPVAELDPVAPPTPGAELDPRDATLASAAIAAVPAVDDEIAPAAEPADADVTAEPYTVLILGDSLAATGFGALLEKRLDAHPGIVCHRKGKSASGLARPDFFDWMAEGKRQIDLRKPDLVVVIMGGNDGQDLTRTSKGGRVPWMHDDWPKSYRERVDAFLKQISADKREVLWLGLPTMGLRSLEKKLVTIRGIQKEAVEALGDRGQYLDTAPFVSGEDGEMLTHADVGARKKRQAIRAEDRIHFTMPGSEYFAGHVYPVVLEALGVEDTPESAE